MFKIYIFIISILYSKNCPFGNWPVCGIDNITYLDMCALMGNFV